LAGRAKRDEVKGRPEKVKLATGPKLKVNTWTLKKTGWPKDRGWVSELVFEFSLNYRLNLNAIQIQTSLNLKIQNKIQETPTHIYTIILEIIFISFYFIREYR
jgi:hypothetical protein